MDEALLAKLAAIVGSARIISDDPIRLEPFGHDEISGGAGHTRLPDAVVFPETEEKIRQIVTLANLYRFPITVRGGGTGLAGGAVPICGGIVLATERLNHILEIDTESLTITLEPGVVVKKLNDVLAEKGLTFPCFPISFEKCFIGGNVATNAGGGRAVKYGVTGRYVLGMRVVTPTGKVLELGGKLQKNVTGYNLMPLLIGSEGTLGIITRLTLKIVPLPTERIDLLAFFPDDRSAISMVPRLISQTGVVPASIEYIDHLSIEVTQRFLKDPLDYHNCGAALLFSLDGFDRPTMEREYTMLLEFVNKSGALGFEVGLTPARREILWNVRRNLAKAFRAASDFQTCEDITLPPGKLPDMLAELHRIADEFGIMIPTFGHAGDGNLHPRIVAPSTWTHQRWQWELPRIFKAMYQAAYALGGQISGEHGIGEKRRKFIGLTVPEENIAWMRSIKQALDPNMILNPGKIF